MLPFPEELQILIGHLKKLPGVGSKTAERFAFELINWSKEDLSCIGNNLLSIQEKVPPCASCGCLTQKERCFFCTDPNRDSSKLCILSSTKDVYAIESTKSFRGLYHVIEHLLSPLDGRHIATLNVEKIAERITNLSIREVIIAFDSTLEGDTTALYLKNQLTKLGVTISRLAFGLPLGASLEHIDSGTLIRSLTGRQTF
jgi:recombination protein RecR